MIVFDIMIVLDTMFDFNTIMDLNIMMVLDTSQKMCNRADFIEIVITLRRKDVLQLCGPLPPRGGVARVEYHPR